MDRYAAELRNELWTMIGKMNEFRWLFVKDPMRDFTRRYKLPLDKDAEDHDSVAGKEFAA